MKKLFTLLLILKLYLFINVAIPKVILPESKVEQKQINDLKNLEKQILLLKENIHKIVEKEKEINELIRICGNNDPITSVKIYFILGKSFYDVQDYIKSKYYYYKAISYVPSEKKVHFPDLYYGLSLTLLMKNETDSALVFSEMALELYKLQSDKRNIGNVYNCIGNILKRKGRYNYALNNFSKALKIFEEMEDSIEMAQILHNMGNLFIEIKNYSKAEEYLLKSLKIKQELKLEKQIITTILSLGNVKFYQKQYDKAEQYFMKSLAWAVKNNNKYFQSIILGNLGSIYNERKIYDKALKYYQRSLELSTSLGRMYGISSTLLWIGEIYYETKHYKKAEENIIKSIDISQKTKNVENLLQGYKLLSNVYFEMKNYEMSLKYFRLYHDLNDSTFNEKIQKDINEIEARYRFESKEKEITLLKNQKRLNQLEIEKNKTRQILLIVIIILIFMLLILFSLFLYKNRKQNKQLKIANEELRKSQDDLKTSMETKDKFFTIIAHDLKNPFSIIQSLSSFLNSKYSEISDSEKKRIIQTIKNSSDITSGLMENLLLWSKTQTGRIIVSKEEINLSDIVSEVIEYYILQANEKKIEIVFYTEESVRIISDKNIISTILRNFLSNAIKFTEEHGKITLFFTKENGYICINVSDTGIGLNNDDMNKLFRIDIDARRIGSPEGKGSGLGLIICKELANICGGKIKVKSELGKGSTFSLLLPT